MQKLGWFWGFGVIGDITIRQSTNNFTFDFNRNYASISFTMRRCQRSICRHRGSVCLSHSAIVSQVALLWQRDRVRHQSVEILQLQNISLENPMTHYLRHSTFSRFDTIPDCDRHTHTESACRRTDTRRRHIPHSAQRRALKIEKYCTAHQL